MSTEIVTQTTSEFGNPVAEPADQSVGSESLETGASVEGGEGGESSSSEAEQPKKERTPEERERQRMQRALDKRTRQLYELRAQLAATPSQATVTRGQQSDTNAQSQTDDEPVTLSRAELAQRIKQEAEKLAPTIRSQQAEIEHRKGVVEGLAKDWGQEKFDTYASELDDALGGLADQKGRPKPATDAIFESDMPKALIEYLTDPDNAEEAEALANANDRQAGRLVAKLEVKLATAKANKPQRSNAPTPIEALKGGGKTSSMPNPSDVKAYMKWANEKEFGKR